MSTSHGLRFDDTRFWVIHRRTEYGPFDYEWSQDLCGIELTFRGTKFGEVCGEHEIFADMKEFRLPRRVVQVASVVFGSVLHGILHGLNQQERTRHLKTVLKTHGCADFRPMT